MECITIVLILFGIVALAALLLYVFRKKLVAWLTKKAMEKMMGGMFK